MGEAMSQTSVYWVSLYYTPLSGAMIVKTSIWSCNVLIRYLYVTSDKEDFPRVYSFDEISVAEFSFEKFSCSCEELFSYFFFYFYFFGGDYFQ